MRILGLDYETKWHIVDVLNGGRMVLKCNAQVVRAVAYAREDSPVVLLRDVCPRCMVDLLPWRPKRDQEKSS